MFLLLLKYRTGRKFLLLLLLVDGLTGFLFPECAIYLLNRTNAHIFICLNKWRKTRRAVGLWFELSSETVRHVSHWHILMDLVEVTALDVGAPFSLSLSLTFHSPFFFTFLMTSFIISVTEDKLEIMSYLCGVWGSDTQICFNVFSKQEMLMKRHACARTHTHTHTPTGA